jgi:hypothetical protein
VGKHETGVTYKRLDGEWGRSIVRGGVTVTHVDKKSKGKIEGKKKQTKP